MKIYKERQLGDIEGIFYTLIMWGGFFLFTFLSAVADLTVVFLICMLTDPKRRAIVHGVSLWWGSQIIKWNPIWKLGVTGLSNVEKGQHYIIVSNHQSLLDILAVLAAVPVNFKFLAKRELFYVPFMGWAMAAAGYIPVNRGSHESGRSAVKRIADYLSLKVSVLLFPEGTRSPDGHIRPFKNGAFKIAKENHVKILPVVVDGTGRALPKKTWFLKNRATFRVSIGKPVSLEHLGGMTLEQAKEKIRHEMISRLAKLRKKKSDMS